MAMTPEELAAIRIDPPMMNAGHEEWQAFLDEMDALGVPPEMYATEWSMYQIHLTLFPDETPAAHRTA